jgi:hypothetical protein
MWAVVVAATGLFVLGTSERVVACSCAGVSDSEAFERADAVFTGVLVDIITPPGELIVSSDPERFLFDVDGVFKGEVAASQAIVTAREGGSCGLEIGGRGPFVVFAFTEDFSTSGAVDGEYYSNLCSGTRPLADGALPASFGEPASPAVGMSDIAEPSTPAPEASVAVEPSSPAAGASVGAASSPQVAETSVVGVRQSALSTAWLLTIAGVIAVAIVGLAFVFHRSRARDSKRASLRSS